MNSLDISTISDNQSEATLLASVIMHPEFMLHLDFVQPGQFYQKENGCLWWSCQQLIKEGVTNIDAINLSNAINSNSAIKRTISEYNITDIQDFINMSQYAARDTLEEVRMIAKNVTTLAYKRDLNKAAMQIQRNCFNSDMKLNDLSSMVSKAIGDLDQKYIISDELLSYGEKADALLGEIIDRRGQDGLSGIPFKWPLLNQFITLEKTECVAVGARMKMGKSALLLNQATYALRNGIPTFYCDCEMSDRLFHERLLSNLSGVPVKLIKRGGYSYEQEQKIKTANEWIKNQPFYHIYLPDHTNEELYAIHKVLKNKMGLELSIFDYIKSNVTSTSENYNILGQTADFLKNKICGELDIAMLTAVQLNRSNEISDSDKIARSISGLLIWEPKENDDIRNNPECGNFKLRVELNRLGEQMMDDEWIDMLFDGNSMRITEAKQHETTSNMPFGETENQ